MPTGRRRLERRSNLTGAVHPGLANGSHTFEARATDRAGNLGDVAELTWSVETLEPDTSIASHPPELSNSASAEFTFSSDVGGAIFECSLDGADWGSQMPHRPSSTLPMTPRSREPPPVASPTPHLRRLLDRGHHYPRVPELTSASSGTTTPEDSIFRVHRGR
ncbi:MAG: hypothetical protein M9922_04200 [Microthrixaceae bacterium]|nr:hypothetical protein [Microthrixaceae bacterium]